MRSGVLLVLTACVALACAATRSPAEHPVPVLGGCVPLGSEMRIRLFHPIGTATARAGDRFTAWVTDPVLAADGTTAIASGSAVWGRVRFVEQGTRPRLGLEVDRVQTVRGQSPVVAFPLDAPIEPRAPNEAVLLASTPISVLLGTPKEPERSIVCRTFTEVPAGQSVLVRLAAALDSRQKEGTGKLQAIILEPFTDLHGDTIAAPGSRIELAITSFAIGDPPTVRLGPGWLETLFGLSPVSANLQGDLRPYAVVPGTRVRSGVAEGWLPFDYRIASNGGATGHEPTSAIQVPAGAELKLALSQPLLVPLPVK